METKKYKKVISINEGLVIMAAHSEGIESFTYEDNSKHYLNDQLLKNISEELVVEFLKCPSTVISLVEDNSIKTDEDELPPPKPLKLPGGIADLKKLKIIATNHFSNESIEINNLGNNVLANFCMLIEANKVKSELQTNPNAPIITHDFIKNINAILQQIKYEYGEVGIGEYRTFLYNGKPNNVFVSKKNEEGKIVANESWQPKKVDTFDDNSGIVKEMDNFVDWVNSENFKELDDFNKLAQFHTKFIEIHPFTDGNGRTDRILTNYISAVFGLPFIDIPTKKRNEYLLANGEAISKGNYDNMISLLKDCVIPNDATSQIFASAINYSNGKTGNSNAMQIEPEESFML